MACLCFAHLSNVEDDNVHIFVADVVKSCDTVDGNLGLCSQQTWLAWLVSWRPFPVSTTIFVTGSSWRLSWGKLEPETVVSLKVVLSAWHWWCAHGDAKPDSGFQFCKFLKPSSECTSPSSSGE